MTVNERGFQVSDIDFNKLVQQILDVIAETAGEGFAAISAVAEKHAKRVAIQTQLLTQSRINGQARDDDEVFDFLKGMLQDMIVNMARVIVALTVLTIEQIWNAVVNVVWGAINTALSGAGLGGILPPGVPEA